MDVQPTEAKKRAIDRIIRILKENGIWIKLDVFYFFAVHDLQAALLNWKEDEYNATDPFDMTFYPDDGFEGETDKYLRTNYIPADDAFHYTLNSASIGVIYKHPPIDGGGNAAYAVGVIEYTGDESWTILQPYAKEDTAAAQINGGSVMEKPYEETSYYALTACYDSETALNYIYVNNDLGESEMDYAAGPTYLSENEIYIGGVNDGGTPFNFYNGGRIACVFIGGFITVQQHNTIYNAVLEYFSN